MRPQELVSSVTFSRQDEAKTGLRNEPNLALCFQQKVESKAKFQPPKPAQNRPADCQTGYVRCYTCYAMLHRIGKNGAWLQVLAAPQLYSSPFR
jgi:hypothetical protein